MYVVSCNIRVRTVYSVFVSCGHVSGILLFYKMLST